MPELLGINTSGDGSAVPSQLAAAGAGWVRCVVRQNIDITSWIQRLERRHGIKTLLIADGSDTSLTKDEARWRQLMLDFKARYGEIVKLWQFGNEPDRPQPQPGEVVASWIMDRPTVNGLMRLAREIFPREEGFTLVAPGLESGNWMWLSDTNDGNGNEVIDFSPVDVLDLHPYAKDPDTQPLIDMFRDYRREFNRFGGQGKPIWCTEYDSRTPGMGADLLTRATQVAIMCWDSGMTTDENLKMGIIDGLDRMNNFRDAAGLAAFTSPDELNALASLVDAPEEALA